MLSSEWLHSFSVFAEHLNFTHAAEALHLSQPALHAQIRKLSESLGVPLYRRVGRELELTKEGTLVLAFARDLRSRSDELFQLLRTGSSRQPVVLSAGEGAYLYLLGEAIRQFRSAAARPLKLFTHDALESLDAVRSGEAHLGVAALDVLPRDLEVTKFTEVEQMLVMPTKHPLARKRQIRLRDLEGAKLIVPPADRPHRVALSRALLAEGVSWEPVVEASGWELMLHFVRLGLGLAVVNGCCRIVQGLAARPLKALPGVPYHLFHRRGLVQEGPPAELKQTILDLGSEWRRTRSSAWARRSAG